MVDCTSLVLVTQEQIHPNVHEEMVKGNFSFQKTFTEFSCIIATDQVLEQNIKVINGWGGATHLLNKEGGSALIIHTMKRTRNLYHYAIRKCKRSVEQIKKNKLLMPASTAKVTSLMNFVKYDMLKGISHRQSMAVTTYLMNLQMFTRNCTTRFKIKSKLWIY